MPCLVRGGEPVSDPHLSPEPVQGLLRFSHQAMATTFEVLVCHPRPVYAGQAAREAFALLNRIEQQLSRFVENSDASRVNGSRPGQPVLVGPETFECLQQARLAWDLTGGAFDVTVGTRTAPAGMDTLVLDESTMTVTRAAESVRLDLGGIGKGFALDRMAQVLRKWGIDVALVHGGASTVLALDPPPGAQGWPVTVTCPFEAAKVLARIDLCRRALSGSSQVSRAHILDPCTGTSATAHPCAWSGAPSGALADALSTAFVVMGSDGVADLCARDHQIGALLIQRTPAPGKVLCESIALGLWPGRDGTIPCRCP